jgi:type I restriction enzyme R subunit
MDEDPVFYRRFGRILQETIDAYRAKRISEADYLKRATEVMNSVLNRSGDQTPKVLEGRATAKAFYGVVDEVFDRSARVCEVPEETKADVALRIDDIVRQKVVVDWCNNSDVQNEMRNAIDDLLYETKAKSKIHLTTDDMDSIVERSIDISKHHYPR